MKKNFTVNIGGRIFNIDEDAYEILSAYLDHLRKHFAHEEGHEEILWDIEHRVAEMLYSKLNDSKQIITLADAEEVIGLMGDPAEIGADPKENSTAKDAKRFYRNPDEKVIGGVCGGLAAYFHTNPMWVRLAFILITLLGFGIGIIAYLVIWLLVPEARTTTERLEMKGKKVNIHNIEESLKEELQELNKRFKGLKEEAGISARRTAKEGKNLFEKVFGLVISILGNIFRAFVILFGLLFMAVGVFLIIGILVSFMMYEHVYYVSSYGINTFSIPAFLNILVGPSDQSIAMIGIALVTGIPLLMLIYIGSRLIFRFKAKSRFVGIPAFGLFLAGLIFCAVSGLHIMKNFSQSATSQKTEKLISPSDNILKIIIKNNPNLDRLLFQENIFEIGSWNILSNEDTSISFGRPSLEIIKSVNDTFYVSLIGTSRGKDRSQAFKRAFEIKYQYMQNDTALILDPYFFLADNEKFRGQRLKLVISVPVAKHVDIQKDAENYFNMEQLLEWPWKGKPVWTMTDDGLKERRFETKRLPVDSLSMKQNIKTL